LHDINSFDQIPKIDVRVKLLNGVDSGGPFLQLSTLPPMAEELFCQQKSLHSWAHSAPGLFISKSVGTVNLVSKLKRTNRQVSNQENSSRPQLGAMLRGPSLWLRQYQAHAHLSMHYQTVSSPGPTPGWATNNDDILQSYSHHKGWYKTVHLDTYPPRLGGKPCILTMRISIV